MERKDSMTMKQFYYLMTLMNQQIGVERGVDLAKFEEIEKVKIFDLTWKECSDLIDKLKGDKDWLERVSNQVFGTN